MIGKSLKVLVGFIISVLLWNSSHALGSDKNGSPIKKYFPIYLKDGDKWKTESKSVTQIKNQSKKITSNATMYSWVDGSENISGQKCKKIYFSASGFYKENVPPTKVSNLISYVALIGNEYRTYRMDQIMKDKTVNQMVHDPYSVLYIVLEQGKIYSHDFKFYSSGQTIENSTTYEMVGFENISTSFGKYKNCLKYTKIRKTQFPGFEIKETIWAAQNLGIVKTVTEGPVSKAVTEYFTTYYQ